MNIGKRQLRDFTESTKTSGLPRQLTHTSPQATKKHTLRNKVYQRHGDGQQPEGKRLNGIYRQRASVPQNEQRAVTPQKRQTRRRKYEIQYKQKKYYAVSTLPTNIGERRLHLPWEHLASIIKESLSTCTISTKERWPLQTKAIHLSQKLFLSQGNT